MAGYSEIETMKLFPSCADETEEGRDLAGGGCHGTAAYF
jgi:hypothetical protein